jgi:hypothetical protein
MLRLPRPAQDTAKESREECCVEENKDRAVKPSSMAHKTTSTEIPTASTRLASD